MMNDNPEQPCRAAEENLAIALALCNARQLAKVYPRGLLSAAKCALASEELCRLVHQLLEDHESAGLSVGASAPEAPTDPAGDPLIQKLEQQGPYRLTDDELLALFQKGADCWAAACALFHPGRQFGRHLYATPAYRQRILSRIQERIAQSEQFNENGERPLGCEGQPERVGPKSRTTLPRGAQRKTWRAEHALMAAGGQRSRQGGAQEQGHAFRLQAAVSWHGKARTTRPVYLCFRTVAKGEKRVLRVSVEGLRLKDSWLAVRMVGVEDTCGVPDPQESDWLPGFVEVPWPRIDQRLIVFVADGQAPVARLECLLSAAAFSQGRP